MTTEERRCPICSSTRKSVRHDLGWAGCDGACHNDWHDTPADSEGRDPCPRCNGDHDEPLCDDEAAAATAMQMQTIDADYFYGPGRT